ncbi:MAG: hypothetical protein ACTSWG_15990 [Candidatus Helarchaeota archaeon]
MTSNNEELIKGFLIFEKRSGRPFIHRTYPGFNADPFLLIGFLNAMIKFAREAMVGHSDIRMIDMQNLRFAFMESKNIIFTAITSNLCSPLDLEFKIKTIESLFMENFTEKEWNNPSLSLDHYKFFNEIVDEVIKGEVKYIEKKKIKIIKKVLEKFKEEKEEILGLAIISFTGIILVNILGKEYYDIIARLINSLFSSRISGIRNFFMKLVDKSIYIKLVSIDSYVVYVSSKDKLSDLETEEYTSFEKKISEILEKED